MDVDGKVAIVTGGGTGLGASVVRKLAAKGARVVVNYAHSEAEAEATAAKCGDHGGAAIAVRADIADDSDCRALAKAAVDRWGRLDVLVNNAGKTRFVPMGDLDGLTADDFLDLYRVNAVGAFQMIRACAPAMRAAGAGAIVNISSAAAVLGEGSSLAYCAAKGALNTLGLSMARVLAPEIRVNTVCPGMIKTRWHGNAEQVGALADKIEARVPLAKAGEPDQVAEAVLWFIEGADLVTGETVLVDGGLHLVS